MTTAQWLGIAISICTLVAAFATSVRWLVKHYLNDLVPNSGSSIKDQITRLEDRQQEIFLHMLKNSK